MYELMYSVQTSFSLHTFYGYKERYWTNKEK